MTLNARAVWALLSLEIALLCPLAGAGQTAPAPVKPPPEQFSEISPRLLFEEADAYMKAKTAELEKQKQKPDQKTLTRLRQEQRDLAAKYATELQKRDPRFGEALYYLGRLY